MKRRRKIPPVDQLQFMVDKGLDSSCDIKIQSTDHDRIMVIINQKCAYPDNEETFQLVRALVRTGACQWGSDWLERCQRYAWSVKVIDA